MSLIVQKFGGSSVGDVDRIRNAANIVAQAKKQNKDVVVVVSAMQGETNRLYQLAQTISDQPPDRELDFLMASGEQVSAALMSLALKFLGHSSHAYTGGQAGIFTDGQYGRANIVRIDDTKLKADLNAGIIPVVAGFQGIDSAGNITTLGRGGSDLTAVALASALNADECQIYTDVAGVYTSDPRVVPEARLLEQISYAEMYELAGLGAKVLQLSAVEYAHKFRVPVRVLSTFMPSAGTLVRDHPENITMPLVSGIAFDKNHAKLCVLGIPNQALALDKFMTSIRHGGVNVDMLIDSMPEKDEYMDLSFIVQLVDYKKALSICEKLAKEMSARDVIGNKQIAKLSLVGLGMKSHASVASKMFQTLGEQGIAVHLITSTEIKISVVIDERFMELGARTLHSAFGLA